MRRSLLLLVSTQFVHCVPPTQLQTQDRPVANLNHDPALGSQLTFSDAALNAGSDHQQVSLFAQAMNQTEMASSLFDRILNVRKTYVCKAPSIRTACPTLVNKETNSIPDLTVPANARWLLEGPSYMLELFYTLSAANGGCTAQGDEPMFRVALKGDGLLEVCHLPNGARLYHSGSKGSTEDIIDVEKWTHGFFMDYHGSEYDAEHAAAAKEGREPDPAKMRDAQGRDMCLPNSLSYGCCDDPIGHCCATPPREKGFAGYMDCIDELGHVGAFRAALGSGVKTTVVVPWHLLKPAKPPSGSYIFTNERAVERDCTTGLQKEGLDSHGFHVWGISMAKKNRKNNDGTPAISGHQCVVACDSDACHLGSVVWIAHDIVRRALKA